MPHRVPPVDPKWPVWSGFRTFDRPGHLGVDWAAPTGEPLLAPAAAVVIQGADRPEGEVRGYGNWIWARTGDGYDWVLGHMPHASIRVRAGDRVRAGEQVAVVGSEGQSTGPHAHLSVYRGRFDQDAPAIDPLPWIEPHRV